MKRIRLLSLLMATIMLAGAFGCASGNPDSGRGTPVPTEKQEEPTEEPVIETGIDEPLDLEYASAFKVSAAFSSNMVVQRGEHIRIWGWADESENGKKVSGEFMGMFSEAEIVDGEWVITFKKRLEANAEEGNNIRIYTDTQEEIFENVLVGDVYMCMGQSNCAYNMMTYWSFEDAKDEARAGSKAIDKTLPIRIQYNTFTVATGIKRGTEDVNKDVKTRNKWRKATASSITQFSAIGYLFAFNYVKSTDGKVPVGVIEIDGNGQPIGAFVPNQVAEECDTDTWNSKKNYYVTSGVNADWGRFIYNEYMYPFERMAIAGVIWYQGESDFTETLTAKYVNTFTALMKYMRGTHNLINKDFPVYYVEFPSIYPNTTGASQWAYMDIGKIRAVMGGIVNSLPNSYQIVSCDCWSDKTFWNSLHPNCKFEQARRGADIALAVNNEAGMTLEKATGPIVESITYSKDLKKATIKFTNVGSGLATSDGGKEVRGFKGLASSFTLSAHDVTAKIEGTDTVVVTATFELAGIAYNAISENYFGTEINLCNSEGQPAGAFLYNR